MAVYSSAIDRIGPLARKITVITATNDRALALSGRIAGGMTRVGAAEKAAIERLGGRVIDASDSGWGVINHDLFLSNAEGRRGERPSIATPAPGNGPPGAAFCALTRPVPTRARP